MADDYTPTITTRSEGLLGRIGKWGAALITDEEMVEAVAAHDAEKRAEWEAEQGEPEWMVVTHHRTRAVSSAPMDEDTARAVAGWSIDDGIRRELLSRRITPWLPVPDTTNREIRADDEPNCCGAGEWVCSSTCSAPKWTALEEATNNESEG